MPQQTFRVDGLHCGGCVNTVSAAIRELSTVTSVEVDLGDGGPSIVRIESTGPLTVGQVRAALSEEGDFSVLGP